jgi:hypothetical protein
MRGKIVIPSPPIVRGYFPGLPALLARELGPLNSPEVLDK